LIFFSAPIASPFSRLAFQVSGSARVVEATSFGIAFSRSAYGPVLFGHALENIS
jgi:hypothetical protein